MMDSAILIVVIVLWVYAYVKTDKSVYFKYLVYCTSSKLKRKKLLEGDGNVVE